MEIIDYSKLKEVKLVEIEPKSQKKYRLLSLFVLINIVLLQFIEGQTGLYVGISISLLLFLIKYLRNNFKKEKFIFLSQIDDNYIEIVYKNKLQSINAKVTCHPECNPVRIVQNESNRLYTLSNTSGSILVL